MATDTKKWTFMRSTYPRLPLDPTYDEVISAIRGDLEGRSDLLSFIAREWNIAANRKAELTRELSEVDAHLVVYERLVYEKMEAQDLEKVTVAGHTYSRSESPNAKVEDQEAYLEWIRKEMPDYLNVHPSRTLSLVKSELEKGADCVFPPGLDVSFRPVVGRRKA